MRVFSSMKVPTAALILFLCWFRMMPSVISSSMVSKAFPLLSMMNSSMQAAIVLRLIERRIQKLRNDIREDLEAKEAEEEEKEEDDDDDDDDDETEEKEKQLACSIRVMDVGSVKRGEPDILSPPSGKQELKRFLLSDRRRSAHSAV